MAGTAGYTGSTAVAGTMGDCIMYGVTKNTSLVFLVTPYIIQSPSLLNYFYARPLYTVDVNTGCCVCCRIILFDSNAAN